jgi:hypothetical protein
LLSTPSHAVSSLRKINMYFMWCIYLFGTLIAI